MRGSKSVRRRCVASSSRIKLNTVQLYMLTHPLALINSLWGFPGRQPVQPLIRQSFPCPDGIYFPADVPYALPVPSSLLTSPLLCRAVPGIALVSCAMLCYAMVCMQVTKYMQSANICNICSYICWTPATSIDSQRSASTIACIGSLLLS